MKEFMLNWCMLDIFKSFTVDVVEVQKYILATNVKKKKKKSVLNSRKNSKPERTSQCLCRVSNLGHYNGTPREVTEMNESLLLGFAWAKESQSFRYLNYFNNPS